MRAIRLLPVPTQPLDLCRYPPIDAGPLREALGRYVGAPADQVICGAGLDDVLNTLAMTVLEPGDEVIISEPKIGRAHV